MHTHTQFGQYTHAHAHARASNPRRCICKMCVRDLERTKDDSGSTFARAKLRNPARSSTCAQLHICFASLLSCGARAWACKNVCVCVCNSSTREHEHDVRRRGAADDDVCMMMQCVQELIRATRRQAFGHIAITAAHGPLPQWQPPQKK